MAAPPSLSAYSELPAVKELPASQRTTVSLTPADYGKLAGSRYSFSFLQKLSSFLTRLPQALSIENGKTKRAHFDLSYKGHH